MADLKRIVDAGLLEKWRLELEELFLKGYSAVVKSQQELNNAQEDVSGTQNCALTI